MKLLVVPKHIEACGCENEGTIEVHLPDHNQTINCYFVGCADSIGKYFEVGVQKEAEITFWHGNIQETVLRKKQIHPMVVGIYSGDTVDGDGDALFIIDSIFPVATDNELGGYTKPENIGSWVECSGQFVIEKP